MAAGRRYFWIAAGLALATDQITKLILWRRPAPGRGATTLIPGLLRIIPHSGNRGGAMGLPGGPTFYAFAALLGLGLIALFFLTTSSQKGLVHAALGLLAGGAIGNLIDRLALGYVRDFVDLHWRGAYHWPTFNLADTAICVGFVLILWDFLFGPGTEYPQEAGGEERA